LLYQLSYVGAPTVFSKGELYLPDDGGGKIKSNLSGRWLSNARGQSMCQIGNNRSALSTRSSFFGLCPVKTAQP
jgi:hypothetical protein